MGINERISTIMKDKGISQNKLAKTIGMSQSGLSSIIRGASSPKEETLRLIASGLGVSITDLLDESPAQEKPAHEMSRQELLSQIDIRFSQLPDDLKREAMAYVAGRIASRKE